MGNNLLDTLEDRLSSDLAKSLPDRNLILEKIDLLKKQRLNIMFVGATGVGKSSTINAIFDTEVAKVGYSADPETSVIQKYEIDNMVLWDTPGLGDNPENDKKYAVDIANTLKEKDNAGNLVIDEVVILVDGSNRDMKTFYEVFENLIVPYIQDTKRMIIAINQCDLTLKGRHWNEEKREPETPLIDFLDDKVSSIHQRILESTGISTDPIYYSALYHYNISKLLLTMLKIMPDSKRFLLSDSLNRNPEIWKKNDSLENYNREIQQEVRGSLTNALSGAASGASAGQKIGKLIPFIGPVIGAVVGAILGFLGGMFDE